MNERAAYDVDFDWTDVHGRLVTLLSDRPERGVVVDLGCGYAPHAEHLRDAGFTFVGFDSDEASVAAVRTRGFDARELDLSDANGVRQALDTLATESDQPIVGVLALDVIEHLVGPHLLLDSLGDWMIDHGVAALGVSIPNVSYRDIAAKLLAGRWDVTPTGLLDQTHLRFFTDASLTSMMRSTGFVESDRDDRVTPTSDQHWPATSPFVSPHSRLGAHLRTLRDRVEPHGDTHQFVRLYRPEPRLGGRPTLLTRPPEPGPGISVFGARMKPEQREQLEVELNGQTSDDWAIIGNLEHAAHAYIAVVRPGEHLRPTWVESIQAAIAEFPGATIRCGAARSGAEVARLDEAALLGGARGPSAVLAIPVEAFRMGFNTATWIELTGIVDVPDIGVDLASDWQPQDTDPSPYDTQMVPASVVRELLAMRADNAWLNDELKSAPVRAVRRLLRRPASRRADAGE